MSLNRNITTMFLFFAALAIVGLTLATPTMADEHEDMEAVYGDIETVDGVEEDEDYILEIIDLHHYHQDVDSVSLEETNIVPNYYTTGDEDETAEFNTMEAFDQYVLPEGTNELIDPSGEYSLRETIDGFTLEVSDQHSETGSDGENTDEVVIDEVNLENGVDYYVVVSHDGEQIGEEMIENGEEVTDLIVELDDTDVEDGDELNVHLERHLGFDEEEERVLVQEEETGEENTVSVNEEATETLAIDDEEEEDNVNEDRGSQMDDAFAQMFELTNSTDELTFEINERDQILFEDRLNTDEEPLGPLGVPHGSEVVVAGNEFEAGGSVVISTEEGEQESKSIVESDSINEVEVAFDTGEFEGQEFTLSIEDEGEEVFTFETMTEVIDLDIDPNPYIIDRSDNVELEISNTVSSYDLILQDTTEEDQDHLVDLIDDSEVDIDYELVTVEDEEGEEMEAIRFYGLNESETIALEEIGSESTFEFNVYNPVTGTSDDGVLEVQEMPEGSISFVGDSFEVAQGDRIDFEVDNEEVEVFEFVMESESSGDLYSLDLVVDDIDENVTVTLDTYVADGQDAVGETVDVEDVFEVENAEIQSHSGIPEISGGLDNDDEYSVSLLREGERVAGSPNLNVVEPEIESLQSFVMPHGTDTEMSSFDSEVTQQEDVVMEDVLVYEIEMTGFDSTELLTDETDPAVLSDPEYVAENSDEYDSAEEFVIQEVEGLEHAEQAQQFNLMFEGEDIPNQNEVEILPHEASNLETSSEDNAIYLFFEVEEEIFENYNEDVDHIENEYHFSTYDVEMSHGEEYKYMNEEQEATSTTTVHERAIETTLQTVQVDEGSYDTRHLLENTETSMLTAETFLAPGTEVNVVVQDKFTGESPTVYEERSVEVEEGNDINTLETMYDMSDVEDDRLLEGEYVGYDSEVPMITGDDGIEPPQIEEMIVEQDEEVPRVGAELMFSAELSGADDVSYSWDFDDGSTSSIPEPVHSYDEEGVYTVTLTVEHPETGETDTMEMNVEVESELRTAPEITNVIAPEELFVGQEGSFGVVASDDQAESTELEYEWDFDGVEQDGMAVQHVFNDGGVKQVEVTVSDPVDDSLSDTETVLVDVNPEEDEVSSLTVEVIDEENDAIALANVEVIDDDGNVVEEGETNSEGVVTMSVEDDSYNLSVDAENFESSIGDTVVDGDTNEVIQLESEEDDENGNDENGETESEGDDDGMNWTLVGAIIAILAGIGFVAYRYVLS